MNQLCHRLLQNEYRHKLYQNIKMLSNEDLEKRIENLEKEVQHLKAALQYQTKNQKRSISS